MQRSHRNNVLTWSTGSLGAQNDGLDLIAEEPLSIRVQGRPYMVVMRTPGDELAHAAGLCLAEGLIREPSDIVQLAFCDGDDTNTVTVTLEENAARRLGQMGERRAYISQTGCGLCGKELIQDLHTAIQPVSNPIVIPIALAHSALADLNPHQPLRAQTRAAHAAVIYDQTGGLLTVAEDVGRHTALDKAVGRLFLDNQLPAAAMIILSSRLSYELVQKAACARIPIMVSMSRPTALAVELARSLNMTLATKHTNRGLWIHTGADRLQMS